MLTLQRVLAGSVVQALESREHVLVAPGSNDALQLELERIIAPALPTITPHLSPHHELVGEITSTFGHDAADDAVETMVDEIAEHLMESSHIDDIFAEDRLIRRDSFRAIRVILMRYIAGDIEVEPEQPDDDCRIIVLDSLGYVVANVAQLADPTVLGAALARAADAVGVQLLELDAAERRATYSLGDEVEGTLALEEAITEELVDLVESEVVELPSIEQILQLSEELTRHDRFSECISAAVKRTRQRSGCAVACTVVDASTLLATLTPLSEEEASNAEAHFGAFIEELEAALTVLAEAMVEEANTSDPPVSDTRATKSSRDSSARKRKTKRKAG
jgi:hypothetical protein